MKCIDCNKELEGRNHRCEKCKILHNQKRWKKYSDDNADKKNASTLKYYYKNKTKCNLASKKYREDNKDELKVYHKKYYSNITDEQKNQRLVLCKNWKSNKRQTDPSYKIKENVSRAVRHSLNFSGLSKNGRHWEDLVGYTSTDLKEHLEKQFVDGMSWDNYGEWHIDHIVPSSFFEFSSTDDVEFRMCWRLDNLQPLWAKDNLAKSNKLVRSA